MSDVPVPSARPPRAAPAGSTPRPTPAAAESHLSRIQHESTALVQDVKEWVELRLDLVRAEVQETIKAQIDGRKAAVLALVVPGLLGAIGALFLLVTLALFLGWWLGHAAWGFLIVTVLLLVVAAIAHSVLDGKAKAVAKTT